jgi:hypothetical protein
MFSRLSLLVNFDIVMHRGQNLKWIWIELGLGWFRFVGCMMLSVAGLYR